MNAQEKLVVAEQEKQNLKQSLQRSGELVVMPPVLPAEIPVQPRSLAATTPPIRPEPVVPHITDVDDLFEEDEKEEMPVVSIVREASPDEEDPPADISDLLTSPEPAVEEGDVEEEEEAEGEEEEEELVPGEHPETEPESTDEESEFPSDRGVLPRGVSFNRAQWFDLLKWAHHSGTLTQEQRMQIVRMGRLIQKGRKLTRKQEEQVMEMIGIVQAQGYRFT